MNGRIPTLPEPARLLVAAAGFLLAATHPASAQEQPHGTENLEVVGRLMNVSHDGDRVSMAEGSERIPWESSLEKEILGEMRSGDIFLHLLPGGYRVSMPEIDRLVDIALGIEGVLGARLTGAGLGGSVVILAHQHVVGELLAKLERDYYAPRGRSSQAEVCRPLAGCSFFSTPGK